MEAYSKEEIMINVIRKVLAIIEDNQDEETFEDRGAKLDKVAYLLRRLI